MAVDNPRHPHHCVIYRIEGETPYNEGDKLIVYEGACRNYQGYRPTEPDGVGKETYALSIPKIYTMNEPSELKPREGDYVEITDRLGTWFGSVKRIMAGNLGTTIHWEDVKR